MRPSPLDRKLLRDLWRLRWQVMAIALLVACGVSVTVMAFSAQRALREAQERFYAETRFADVFAAAKRAPLSEAADLARIDGVTAVDARIVETGLLNVPGQLRPAIARLVSLPDDPAGGLNRIRLSQGRMPDPRRRDEVVALNTFLQAAGLKLGDKLTAVVGGRALTFSIVGAALSPEYIFVPSPESFMPDDAHQAVFWAPRAMVERAGGLNGAFNAVALDIAPGVPVQRVLQAVDRRLGPYGGRMAYAREDQVSHAFLTAELKELSTSAVILPPVFLLVAAALVHMVVGRLVEAEREQIGLLKAFGYGDLQAASPYLRFAGAIGLVGAAAGGLLGGWFGAAMVDQYRAYFRFPVLDPAFEWTAFALAAAAAIAAALAGSAAAVRRAVALSPAVAMQPPRPAAYRVGILDRLPGGRALDEATRMIVRNLERYPARAVFTTLGLSASLALLVGAQFMFDSLEAVVDQAYYRTQRWSDAIAFAEPRDTRALGEARRLPGVYGAEPVRVVAARFKANGREEMTRLTGLEPDARLNRPLAADDRPIPFEGRGLILSEALATKLRVAPGQRVRVEVVDGRAPMLNLPVTALAEDFSGFSAYMSRAELNRLMGDGDVASGAQLLVAADRRPAFYRAIDAIPQIVAASSRDDTVASWRQVMTEAFRVSISFYVGFAGAIAFGVAFNTSRIALSERSRDLATLRVLGFGQRDCAYILLGELLILGLLAAPIGVIAGNLLARGMSLAYARDELRLPLRITLASYGTSIGLYLAAVGLAAALVARRVWGLDLVSVLKTRE